MAGQPSSCACEMGERVDAVLSRYPAERDELIHILQGVQNELGYLPGDAMRAVARYLEVPDSAVYSVATFYAQFHLTRQGRHKITVCQGTACHVRGARRILQAIQKKLGIKPGQTTQDYEFSLERVACLGSCALSPVMVVDGKVHGSMSPVKAQRLIDALQQEQQAEPEKVESASASDEAQ